jgi:hypothetical protein
MGLSLGCGSLARNEQQTQGKQNKYDSRVTASDDGPDFRKALLDNFGATMPIKVFRYHCVSDRDDCNDPHYCRQIQSTELNVFRRRASIL